MSSARPICGNCPTCLGRTNRIAQPRRSVTLLPGTAPTAAGLERHARRFGSSQVAETAAEYGLSVALEREVKRAGGRLRGPTLRERVAAHVDAGHNVEAIAEIEDLSPARARRLVAEVQT